MPSFAWRSKILGYHSIEWFGRDWFQIKTKNSIIHIDPAYAKTYLADYEKRTGSLIERLEKEKTDLILVTHSHADHCKAAEINKLRCAGTSVIAPRSCTRKIGGDVEVIEPGEEIVRDGITIKAVEAYNIEQANSSKKIWHRRGDGVGYFITLEGKTIYHAGDTDFIPEMKELGPVDAALLPIGGTFTMDIQEAACAALAIKPRVIIPMHNLEADPEEFKNIVEAESHIKVVPLKIGETYHLK